MVMYDILEIDIRGHVDQAGLERLRAHLALTKFGRLTDDWDQQFGYRRIERADGQYTKIVLFRNFDESWQVLVVDTEDVDPEGHDFAVLRTELTDGIGASGFGTDAAGG